MTTERNNFDELAFYTLAHPSPAFIHQHAVDAYFAQSTSEQIKPIGLVFALVGLYLYVEGGFSGRQVQKVHMQLARQRKQWPKLDGPPSRGAITVKEVIAAPPGDKRDEMIHRWCVSVWQVWQPYSDQIAEILMQAKAVAGKL